jgi:hypothetical protein
VSVRALWGGFVYDDRYNILGNPWVLRPSRAFEAFGSHLGGFSSEFSTSYYRPVMHLWLAACSAIGGITPWVFHLSVVLAHLAVVACVFALASRWALGAGAFVGALWFAVHPIHVEAFAWNAGIVDVSCALFALGTLLAAASERPWIELGATPVLFLFALLSKEPAVMILPAIAIVAWRSPRRLWLAGGLSAAAGVYLTLRVSALGGLMAGGADRQKIGLADGFATALELVARYAAKLVLPLGLSAVYDVTPGVRPLLAVCGLAVLAAAVALAWRFRRDRAVLLGLALLALPLLPALYVPVLGDGLMADRYLYLPSAGAALLLAVVVNRARVPRVVLVGASAAVIAALALAAVVRVSVWRDDLSLWTDAAESQPGSAVAHASLGFARYEAKDYPGAVESLSCALQIDPSRSDARVNLALALCAIDRPADAIREVSFVLERHPGFEQARAVRDYAVAKLAH